MQAPLITSAEVPVLEKRILLVEDETVFAKAVKKHLERARYKVDLAGDLATARAEYKSNAPDLILLDMRLPDGSGLDFLAEIKTSISNTSVLVMSAYGELEDAVSAMKLGASDYLKKPIDLKELLINVEQVFDKNELTQKLTNSAKREQNAAETVDFLGKCQQIKSVREQVERISQLSQSAEVIPPTVLILGETGTGKDVIARLLHAYSSRNQKPFVHVDCASLPKDLIESELFGHEKGAFTNAHVARTGLIEAAEDGVLFLDEIGELPLDLQSKLLAVLERRTLRRVGTTQERPVAAWIVAATNRDIESLADSGEFRSDLYYRLNVMSLSMPALRERGKDILLLADHFATHTARRYGLQFDGFSDEAEDMLLEYPWPGNVREMKHLLERAVLLKGGGVLEENSLGLNKKSETKSDETDMNDDLTLGEAELHLIKQALERTNRNVSKAARELGITRMALRYRIKKYDL
ncbi:MAG TPA: sigma-54-dependent Fis family transcriptional regulator [Thiotrichaceae bacterium]|jgi:DNA-binding NtrC family response regulator|nr:sigma-54-dependent Fis family transcriptional regulator [Thiotrichaceae bacterium]HIM07973.1 sigma-54-dependent Fis family transcriptional regulator [Gammaproteobacteria bacterium]